jgi:hypothetical protein
MAITATECRSSASPTAACNTRHPDQWIDKCDETLSRIAATIGPGGNIVGEASMEKINYAASAAYFVKSDTFITFSEGSGIDALEPGRTHLLPATIERMARSPQRAGGRLPYRAT